MIRSQWISSEDEVVSKADFRDPFQLFAVEDAAGGVVWIAPVQHAAIGLTGGGFELIPIDLPAMAGVEHRHVDAPAPCQLR